MTACRNAQCFFTSVCFLVLITGISGSLQKANGQGHTADTVHVITERDLIPESIAYDPALNKFYAGSLFKRKIVWFTPGGKTEDLTKSDSIGSVLGIKIGRGDTLWILHAVTDFISTYRKSPLPEGGYLTAIHKGSGKILKTYPIPDGIGNDLVITHNNDIFLTATNNGAVCKLDRETDQIEYFIPKGTFSFPNGITSSGETLYVADGNSFFIIQTKTKRVTQLRHSPKDTLGGFDGIYFYNGTLIGVQNGIAPRRVVQIHLSKNKQSVTKIRLLDSHDVPRPYYSPTTGVIHRNDFYFISNAQLKSFDDQGRIFPYDMLKDVIIKRIPLNR